MGLTATTLVQPSVGIVSTILAIEISLMLQAHSSTSYAGNIYYKYKPDRAYP
jgi:hypothetical protein